MLLKGGFYLKELSFKDSAAIIRKYAGEYHKSKIIELSGAKMEDTIIKEECLKYIDSVLAKSK